MQGQLQTCLDFAVHQEASSSVPVTLLEWYKKKSILPFAFSALAAPGAAGRWGLHTQAALPSLPSTTPGGYGNSCQKTPQHEVKL